MMPETKLQNKFYSAIIKNNAKELTRIINDNKIDINIPIGNTTPLIYSARNNQYDTSKILLQAGAKPDAIDNNGTSALRWASNNKNSKLVRLLLSYNANPNLQNKKTGVNALHISSSINDIKIVKQLLNAGAKVTLKQKNGRTAIDCANMFNASAEVKLLLKQAQELKNNRMENFRKYYKTKHRKIK